MKIDIIKHLHKFKIDNPMVNLYKQQNPRFCHAMKLKIGLKNLVTIKMNEIFLSCLLRSKAQIRCSEIKTKIQKNTVKESDKDEIRTIFLKKVFTKVFPRDDSQYLYCTLYYRFTLHFFFLKIQCDF